jgi:hypothetical protein
VRIDGNGQFDAFAHTHLFRTYVGQLGTDLLRLIEVAIRLVHTYNALRFDSMRLDCRVDHGDPIVQQAFILFHFLAHMRDPTIHNATFLAPTVNTNDHKAFTKFPNGSSGAPTKTLPVLAVSTESVE